MGVPIIRTTVFWGLYWGPPILGNSQVMTAKHQVVTSVIVGVYMQIHLYLFT